MGVHASRWETVLKRRLAGCEGLGRRRKGRHCTVAVRWDGGVDDRQCRETCCLTSGWGSVDKLGDGWWRSDRPGSWDPSTGALGGDFPGFSRARKGCEDTGAPSRRHRVVQPFRVRTSRKAELPYRARERISSARLRGAPCSPGPRAPPNAANARRERLQCPQQNAQVR